MAIASLTPPMTYIVGSGTRTLVHCVKVLLFNNSTITAPTLTMYREQMNGSVKAE